MYLRNTDIIHCDGGLLLVPISLKDSPDCEYLHFNIKKTNRCSYICSVKIQSLKRKSRNLSFPQRLCKRVMQCLGRSGLSFQQSKTRTMFSSRAIHNTIVNLNQPLIYHERVNIFFGKNFYVRTLLVYRCLYDEAYYKRNSKFLKDSNGVL